MTNKFIVNKQILSEIVEEEYKLLLREERINKLNNDYNKLSLKEKKECRKLGYHFLSNLHEAKIIDSKTFNQIVLTEGILNWGANKLGNKLLDKSGPVGSLIRNLIMLKDADLLGILQTVLDIVGFFPAFGEIADGINVAISVLRKDYVGAALSAISMIPGLGDAIAKPIKGLLKVGKGIPLNFVQKIIPAMEKFGPTIIKKLQNLASKFPGKAKNKIELIIPTLEKGLKVAAETIMGNAEDVAGKVGNMAANKIKSMAASRKEKATAGQRPVKIFGDNTNELQPT